MRLRRSVRNLPRAQRGLVLLVMLLIIVAGTTWMMASALNASSSNRTALNRQDAARILAEAKHALIGWVITQAIEAGENNPGRLPCPEPPAFIGTANESRPSQRSRNCAPRRDGPAALAHARASKAARCGRRTALVRGVAGWALPTVTYDAHNQLRLTGSVDGRRRGQRCGRAHRCAGTSAERSGLGRLRCARQVRNALAPDFRDYLECENATSPVDASFATNGPAGSFNDQVLAVTTRDLLPGLEAAIVKRIEREIVPPEERLRRRTATSQPPIRVSLRGPIRHPGPGPDVELSGVRELYPRATAVQLLRSKLPGRPHTFRPSRPALQQQFVCNLGHGPAAHADRKRADRQPSIGTRARSVTPGPTVVASSPAAPRRHCRCASEMRPR